MNSGFGGAMYWVSYCDYLVHKPVLVDATVERQCENFKAVVEVAVPERVGG